MHPNLSSSKMTGQTADLNESLKGVWPFHLLFPAAVDVRFADFRTCMEKVDKNICGARLTHTDCHCQYLPVRA